MSRFRRLVPVVCLLTAAAPRAAAPEPGPRGGRRMNVYDRAVVERLKARAAQRLQDPECRKVLTDFRDREGRTLGENLGGLGRPADEYLLALPFVDGSGVRRCLRTWVIMATVPGLPRVFVCPAGPGHVTSRLARVELESPSLGEAMLIHEMLHTLGLGENPPTTFEITDRVRMRCR